MSASLGPSAGSASDPSFPVTPCVTRWWLKYVGFSHPQTEPQAPGFSLAHSHLMQALRECVNQCSLFMKWDSHIFPYLSAQLWVPAPLFHSSFLPKSTLRNSGCWLHYLCSCHLPGKPSLNSKLLGLVSLSKSLGEWTSRWKIFLFLSLSAFRK